MVFTKRYFIEITSLDPIKVEDFAYGLTKFFPRTCIKVFKAEDIEVLKYVDKKD